MITTKRNRELKELKNSELIKILDKEFSIFIRRSNRIQGKDYCQCGTCSFKGYWKEMQCGHFMTRNHLATRWEEKNCLPQCGGCNGPKGGMQYIMAQTLNQIHGKQTAEQMEIKSKNFWKPMPFELIHLIQHYREQNRRL